ncbi:MAG: hypothetical protein EKK53_25630 [Burkholderiales bacterium]|nr:MAG: hypothetical protein EKK53_25630 [Burkholderiales bacterium]
MNGLIRYFDLQSANRGVVARGHAAAPKQPVLPQYLAVSAGVVAEPFLRKYVEVGAWSLDWSSLGGRVAFGLLVGIVLLPAVYKSSFDAKKPLLVQLAALFPVGIGWQTLFASATKIAGH